MNAFPIFVFTNADHAQQIALTNADREWQLEKAFSAAIKFQADFAGFPMLVLNVRVDIKLSP